MPDVVVAQQVLSLEEFLRLPERKPALEYEDGEVTQKVSPKAKHSLLQQILAGWFARVGGQAILVFTELRVTFGRRSVVPDVAVFRRYLWYVANGVHAALLIDVYDQSVLLFRPGAQPLALRGNDLIDLRDLVPGFAVGAAELFASLKV